MTKRAGNVKRTVWSKCTVNGKGKRKNKRKKKERREAGDEQVGKRIGKTKGEEDGNELVHGGGCGRE